MIVWISEALLLALHERQLAEHGGRVGVRDPAALEAALASPRRLYASADPPSDLAALAASLAFGLARGRPFVDGNTRTAHVAYRVFIALNDGAFTAGEEDRFVAMRALAEGRLDEDGFAAWLRSHIALAPGHRVNEPRARYEPPREMP